MPIKIVDPDTGIESEAFTADEVAAQTKAIQDEAAKKIADNEAHMKEKLDEFQKGKTATELEKEAARAKELADAAESRRIAQEASDTVKASEARRVDALKKMAFQNIVGADPELNKKMEEAWAIINFDTKEDVDFMKKAEMAASMAGINAAPNFSGGMSFGGAFPPGFRPVREKEAEGAYQTFRDNLPGMNDFLSKAKKEDK